MRNNKKVSTKRLSARAVFIIQGRKNSISIKSEVANQILSIFTRRKMQSLLTLKKK